MRWFSRSDAMSTTTSKDVKVDDRARVSSGSLEDAKLFRATLDLRNGDDDAPDIERQEPPAASCAKAFFTKMVNSPIARTILLVAILVILLFLLDRLGGNTEQQDAVRATLRSVFKAAVAPLLQPNVTLPTTTEKQ
jgi:hypothetical protein